MQDQSNKKDSMLQALSIFQILWTLYKSHHAVIPLGKGYEVTVGLKGTVGSVAVISLNFKVALAIALAVYESMPGEFDVRVGSEVYSVVLSNVSGVMEKFVP